MNLQGMPIPAVDFNPPVYVCPRAGKDFVLDGNIDKPFWKDIPFTDDFLDIEGSHMPVPRFATRAKLAWDDENLYIAGLLMGNEIWANQTERDSVIFRDNDFEIFIDPDSDTQQYYEFEMNALNTVWDLLLTKAYRDLGKPVNCFDIHGLKTAVHINGELQSLDSSNVSWSVEVVIPFASICECTPESALPKAGDFYRLNFSRVQWNTYLADKKIKKVTRPGSEQPLPEDNWVWSPTGVINIHYPELWGFIFFAPEGYTGTYEIPEIERVKWELRKLYYAERLYFDRRGRYTDNEKELLAVLDRFSPIKANKTVKPLGYSYAVTPHCFEISCKGPDGEDVSIFADGKIKVYTKEKEED